VRPDRPDSADRPGRPGRRPPVAIRPATRADLTACTYIWSAGLGDYLTRLNQPWFAGDLEPLERLLAHFLATDPSLFLVATTPSRESPGGERIVAFGSATVREDVWFLAMLFVHPEFQRRGIGRDLFLRLLPDSSAGFARGTATDSVQPMSNGLYARFGLVPRQPVLNLVGYVERPDAFPPLPDGTRAEQPSTAQELARADDETAALDRLVLGRERPADHAFVRTDGRLPFVFRRSDGAAVGYAYIAKSGRFGPVAARDPALLAPIVGHLLRAVRPPGAYASWIPGAAGELVVALLQAGLRVEGFPTLLLWDRPIGDFSRYVPINLALL
jgi:ribosomal protein S18 acetylase RimI-like enzyme